MRRPWAAHCASMKFGLASVTTRYPSIVRRPRSIGAAPMRVHLVAMRTCGDLDKITPQHQCGCRFRPALRIIARPAADFGESGARVEPARRHIVPVHFEEDRAQAKARKAPQVKVEQFSRQAAAAPVARD